MKLWPSESFIVETSMTPERVYAALAGATEPRRLWLWRLFGSRSPGKMFQGTVTSGTFELSRIIDYRNSFLPLVTGTIQPCAVGSRVAVGLQLNPLVFGFMALWLGGVSMGCIGVAIFVLIGAAKLHPMLLMPFGMFAFGVCLASAGFWFEVPRTKRLVIAVLDGPLSAMDGPPREL